jgi:hypothetical protein
MTGDLIAVEERHGRMYDSRQFIMAEIGVSCSITPMTIYRHIHLINLERRTPLMCADSDRIQ